MSPTFTIFMTMKKFFSRLQISPGFLLFIVVFAYLDSIRSRVGPGQVINAYIFTPEVAILAIPEVLIIVVLLRYFFQKFHRDSYPFHWQRAALSFGVGLVAWVLVSNLISLLIALAFDNFERNFVPQVVISSNFSKVLDFMIYGGFYFAFLLYQKFQNHQKVLAAYDISLAESTINQLKHQLNPHFLFNNLNILDQLIEENPKIASEFLHDFSTIYRYVLDQSEEKLVPLEKELAFAEDYFRLVNHKYGKSYELEIDREFESGCLIPPLTLQLLIENAVFHNHGTEEEPVKISLEVKDKISVSNTYKPYKFKKHNGGKGLENLKKQYRLLNRESIEIKNTNELFTVQLPLISQAV
jgi:hypothetical protein